MVFPVSFEWKCVYSCGREGCAWHGLAARAPQVFAQFCWTGSENRWGYLWMIHLVCWLWSISHRHATVQSWIYNAHIQFSGGCVIHNNGSAIGWIVEIMSRCHRHVCLNVYFKLRRNAEDMLRWSQRHFSWKLSHVEQRFFGGVSRTGPICEIRIVNKTRGCSGRVKIPRDVTAASVGRSHVFVIKYGDFAVTFATFKHLCWFERIISKKSRSRDLKP